MPRSFSAGFETELAASINRPRIFFEGDFGPQIVRLWNDIGNVSWNSQTWLGNGWLQDVSAIRETSTVQAVGARVVLTGVPTELIALMLDSSLEQGAKGKIWLGFLNSSGAVIADPHLIFDGRFDYPVIQEADTNSTIELHFESALLALETAPGHRYNDEGQKKFFPGDRGFEYTVFLSDWSGFWGKQEVPDNG